MLMLTFCSFFRKTSTEHRSNSKINSTKYGIKSRNSPTTMPAGSSLEISVTLQGGGAAMVPHNLATPQNSISAMSGTFQSSRPAKASNIRVITRIRPLLQDELASGRKVCIHPVLPTSTFNNTQSSTTNVLSCKSQGDIANHKRTTSPQTSIPPDFRPSQQQSSSSDENMQPSETTRCKSTSIGTSKIPTSIPHASSATTTTRSFTSTSTASTSLIANNKQFDFDAVLSMESTQRQVYEAAVGDKITNHIFRGINFTILAYGQTNAGKTATMQGYRNNDLNRSSQRSNMASYPLSESDGIIPRALHDLFQRKLEMKSSGMSTVTMELSYVELYNEEMRDLLSNNDDGTFQPLRMLDQGNQGGVVIEGLTTIPIQSMEQVNDLLAYATKRRATCSTQANIQSSRSHAICTLTVAVVPSSSNNNNNVSGSESTTRAKLTLVDLAGSERIKKTGVVGLQQQESITINQDLFALGQVVSALADKSRSKGHKQTHIPFRNSKLTRLLRESLGGNCYTVLISCVSPTDMDMEESINTLRYAENARSISNSIKRNVHQVMLTPSQCTSLKEENMRLKALVIKLKKRVTAEISRDLAGSLLDQEEEEEAEVCSPTSFSTDKSGSDINVFHQSSESNGVDSRAHTPTNMVLHCSSESPGEFSEPKTSRRSGIPVWKHFQDLAKITKHVSISKESQRDRSHEIELQKANSSNHRIQPTNENVVSMQSPSPSNNNNLVDVVGEVSKAGETSASSDQTKEMARLKAENDQLRQGMKNLVSQQVQIEDSIQSKKNDLDDLSKELGTKNLMLKEKKAEAQRLSQTINRRKIELSNLDELKEKAEIEMTCDRAKCEQLQEEAAYLKTTTDQLVNKINELDLASPQRSFASLLKSFDHGKRGFFHVVDELDTPGEVDLNFDGSFEASQASICNSRSHLVEREAAQIEAEQTNKKVVVLEYELKQARVHVAELKEEVLQLEEAAAKAAEKADLEMDKQREEYESASKTLAAEKEKLVSEKERSKGLEERIGFMHQKYEKMAAAMQEKISDLEEANTLKSKLENQVHCLRMANSDLEIQLSNKEAELEQESSEKENLQSQIHSLGNKIQDLEELLLQQTSGKHSRVVDTTAQEKPNNSTVLIKDATTPQVILSKSSSECSGSSVGNEGKSTSLNRNKSQQPDYIHVKATKMLQLADDAICKAEGKSITSASCCSSVGTEFRPAQAYAVPLKREKIARENPSSKVADSVQIINLNVVENENFCSCTSKTFGEKAEYVDFYLPLVSVECTCGKRPPKEVESTLTEDPSALASILRPWQVAFLTDVGIVDAAGLVHTCNLRGAVLATKLRKWRRAKGLPSVRTKSCGVALHIWSRTCKSVLRSIQLRKAQGLEPKRPDFLELSIGGNHTVVSSLGSGQFRDQNE